jgi:hypothetical protein
MERGIPLHPISFCVWADFRVSMPYDSPSSDEPLELLQVRSQHTAVGRKSGGVGLSLMLVPVA